MLQQIRAFLFLGVLSRVLQELNPCPRCLTEEEIENMSVGSLSRAYGAQNSNLTPGMRMVINPGAVT